MPRKPGLNSEFVMFDVVYEDGTQRSNRKVPRALLGGIWVSTVLAVAGAIGATLFLLG